MGQRNKRVIGPLVFCVAGWALAVAATAGRADEVQVAAACPSPQEAARVREFYADQDPLPATFIAARRLKMPEALVAASLGSKQVRGVAGKHFRDIWASMADWDEAIFLVMKGGHVFEIMGPVHSGKDSTESSYFNLDYGVGGAGGHLRPDRIGSVYAINLSSGKGDMRGVAFYGADGEQAFAVYLGSEGKVPDHLKPRFDETWDLMAGMEPACSE